MTYHFPPKSSNGNEDKQWASIGKTIDTMSTFQYRPLDQEIREIRLLELFPANQSTLSPSPITASHVKDQPLKLSVRSSTPPY